MFAARKEARAWLNRDTIHRLLLARLHTADQFEWTGVDAIPPVKDKAWAPRRRPDAVQGDRGNEVACYVVLTQLVKMWLLRRKWI